MKKLSIFLFTAALAANAAAFSAAADDQTIRVRVTIGNEGKAVVAAEEVTVKDLDGDGKYTIDEALKAAHEQYYRGEQPGYASQTTDWGLSVKTLWGVTNGGSYGYAVNDVLSMGLSDQVKDGDYLSAYVYQDTTGFSDHYAYFDVRSISDVKQGDTVTLKLTEIGYKEDWSQELKPVPNAIITFDGAETAYKTDADGKVDFTFEKAGKHIIGVKADHPLSPIALRANVLNAESGAVVTTQAPAATTAAPDSTTAAETTAAATTTVAVTTTVAGTASQNGTAGSTTKAGATSTGDTNALPAVAVTMFAAFGAALALRRRTDK